MLTAKQEMFNEARALARSYQATGMPYEKAFEQATNAVWLDAVEDTHDMLAVVFDYAGAYEGDDCDIEDNSL